MSLAPISLPDWAWQKADVREALRARAIGQLFRYTQQFSGASQARIATAVDMTQGRVNELINGRRTVRELDVFERIADGLSMPDDARHLLGLAARREPRSGGRAFDLAAFPEVVRVFNAQAAAADEIQRAARTVDELDVLAVRGLGLIGLNDSLLRSSLTRFDGTRLRLRVLLLDPDCSALADRAAEIGESAESMANGVRLTAARVRDLADVCDVQVHWYRSLPTWRLIRVGKVLYLSGFDAGWEGHESALYKVMETPYGPLYKGFRRMFDGLIADGAHSLA
ncbi:helix-turn-helix domain-containing protein [Embleya sp. NPDC020886]|uniref:helix-turn-helix domain-containing protein n=1 Tax=Embleya sp. NPDC020886 TaxID=3363980 RepID=UPI003794D42F